MDLTGYVPDDLHGPIPRDLARLVSLLNTAGIDGGVDQLADLEGLAVWLGPDSSTGATAADLEAARQLRAALRALAASNCGEPLDEVALAKAARWVLAQTTRIGVNPQRTASEPSCPWESRRYFSTVSPSTITSGSVT